MIDLASSLDNQSAGPKDTFISIGLAFYVFSSYLVRTPSTEALGSAALYVFLGITLLKMVTRQTAVKFIPYSIWYFVFAAFASLSLFYALENRYVFTALYTLLVSWVVTFSFIQYVRAPHSILRILSFFAYFPIFLVFYLLLSGGLDTQGQRLGASTFGNANNLAMALMVALCCVSWFVVYGRSKHLLLNITLAIILLYVTALTGGRKFFSIPLVFFFLLLILKFRREGRLSSLVSALSSVILLFVVAWSVANVPALYHSIGVRFAGLFNFLNGGPAGADTSTQIRYLMIEEGWSWFVQQPLIGYGLNNFQSMFSQIFGASYAHNNYIELMVDLGIVGLLAYYSFYIYIIGKLISIHDDATGIRDFFLAFMLVLPIFEIGAVTYNLNLAQIFTALASVYVWLNQNNRKMTGKRAILDPCISYYASQERL